MNTLRGSHAQVINSSQRFCLRLAFKNSSANSFACDNEKHNRKLWAKKNNFRAWKHLQFIGSSWKHRLLHCIIDRFTNYRKLETFTSSCNFHFKTCQKFSRLPWDSLIVLNETFYPLINNKKCFSCGTLICQIFRSFKSFQTAEKFFSKTNKKVF